MIKVPPDVVTMSEWNIVVIKREGLVTEKFLGYWHERDTYRISSQIEKYDRINQTGSTLSGSHYLFLDEPGQLHPEAQFIFDKLNAFDEVSVSLKFVSKK